MNVLCNIKLRALHSKGHVHSLLTLCKCISVLENFPHCKVQADVPLCQDPHYNPQQQTGERIEVLYGALHTLRSPAAASRDLPLAMLYTKNAPTKVRPAQAACTDDTSAQIMSIDLRKSNRAQNKRGQCGGALLC